MIRWCEGGKTTKREGKEKAIKQSVALVLPRKKQDREPSGWAKVMYFGPNVKYMYLRYAYMHDEVTIGKQLLFAGSYVERR